MGQQKIEGVVTYSTMPHNPKSGWGKLEPADGKADVWFGTTAAQGVVFDRGDLVEFIYHNNFRDGKPSAFRVYLKERAVTRPNERNGVTTLAGEFET
jgi:cold shock CspA family protein